jgi:hypothetical protein
MKFKGNKNNFLDVIGLSTHNRIITRELLYLEISGYNRKLCLNYVILQRMSNYTQQ